MQAVILAAGKGTRMAPLETPKPLLKVAGKPFLQHTLERLEGLATEAVIVVGHGQELVRAFLESQRFRLKITVVEQAVPKGTWDALQAARPHLRERFLVMNGDDLYPRADIAACLRAGPSILVQEVADPSRFGVIEERGGVLQRIHEKPLRAPSSLANTGLCVLDQQVFNQQVRPSRRGELELVDALAGLRVVRATGWVPVGYPWDLLLANEWLLRSLRRRVEGKVERGATLLSQVVVGKGTLIRAGAYIEGPVVVGRDCIIGPNCYIRPGTSIGDGCKVGNAVELKNCVIGDHVSIGHLSYLGDSVLGDNINIGAGTIAANLRHDGKPIQARPQGRLLETGRRKLGCIIASGVHTGIHTSIYPGRILTQDTLPGQTVR
ncbi:MAG: NTP transferase domain-containing protein [Candidatus Aenigmarchaeota archaeon]|nr:NTP transferase domain-containing protein [Candidatus Aenigmarchaeota archaeon]